MIEEPLYKYPKQLEELECETFQCSIPAPIHDEFGLFKEWIKCIKMFVYKSTEYKRFVKRCKTMEGIPVCVASGLTNDIELHHHPLPLEYYVMETLQYMEMNNFSYTSLSIADCVVRMHYEGIICYTYLSKSYHSKFHESNDVVIPEEQIRGDMEALIVHPIMKHMDGHCKSRFIEYCPKFTELHKNFFGDIPDPLKG